MGRSEHPTRTPVYGGLLIALAMIGATLIGASGDGLPGWLRTTLLVLALPTAITGWLMTFRDLSNPLPRSRRRR